MINHDLLTVLRSNDVRCRLQSVGWTWEALQRRAESIVVFGSLAVSGGTHFGDVDILCVGEGQTRITPRIDLVWLSKEAIVSPSWLQSELAGHVASYGICVKGDFCWADNVAPNSDNIVRKRHSIQRHVKTASKYWHVFTADFRVQHRRLIRRQIQRLGKLINQEPIPCSNQLDDEWRRRDSSELLILVRQIGLPPIRRKWVIDVVLQSE